MSRVTVALLGAGALGSAIGQRLLANRIAVRAYNRAPQRLAPLIENGASAHATPYQAALGASHVLCVLTDTHASEAVLFGAGGVLEAGQAELSNVRAIIDMGTHDPLAIARLAARVELSGHKFVESPVTGSTHDASHGTLNFLIGGSDDAVAAARPLLDEIGRDVFHLGAVGAGSAAKLAMNQLVGTMAFALGESLAMLQAKQLDVSMFLAALNGSGLSSPLYQRLGQRYLAQDFKPRFSLGHLAKDLELARKLANQLGCSATLAGEILTFIDGLPPSDHQQDYSLLVKRIGHCTA